MKVSPRRRTDILSALRIGTVPERGLDVMAVGLDRFAPTIKEDLDRAASGSGGFKAVRGEYGSGKTFFARWLGETAKQAGFAVAEVQISETETPLHRLETVYRRIVQRLSTAESAPSAFRDVIDGWFHVLERDAIDAGADPAKQLSLARAVSDLMEKRLRNVSKVAPMFSQALRGYRAAVLTGDLVQAEGLLAWLGGEPHVAASVRRQAGIRGDLDHFGALGFLEGLLTVLRDSDYKGLLLVLDEVETLQRVRSDVREKSLNAIRQLIDEIDAGRFPGLYVLMTGTPAFYDGQLGIQRLPPLAQRLHTTFDADARFDNPRAPQIRLTGFGQDSLDELGRRIRDIYVSGSADRQRVTTEVDDAFIHRLAAHIAGELGGRVGVAPRLFLRRLVDIMDRVEQFPDYSAVRNGLGAVSATDMTEEERSAARRGDVGRRSLDDIDLDLAHD
jgi:hypothetical protein